MVCLQQVVLSLSVFVTAVLCHERAPAADQLSGRAPGTDQHRDSHGHGRRLDRDKAHEREHIMEHLDGVVDTEKQLPEEEMNFHYFKLHDYDGNNKLDGIELIAALTDYHKKEKDDEDNRLSDEELTTMLDSILDEDDTNGDGYVDYAEFMASEENL